jgi:hypothetical protein
MRRCMLVAVTLLFAACGPSGPPDPDSCSPGVSTGVTAVQIGPGIVPDGTPFVPYADGDPPQTVGGGQGLTMIPVRLLVSGANPPECLAQSTIVCNDPDCANGGFAHSDVSVHTYVDAGGRSTHPLFIVLDDNLEVKSLRTTVGGVTKLVRFGDGLDMSLPVPDDMSRRD